MTNLPQTNKFVFKILWSTSWVGVAVDEVDSKNYRTPLTAFYFWPREDGWKLLKSELESKPWMNQKIKQELLNSYTSIVNFWLENINNKTKIEKIRQEDLNLKLELLAKT
jgi:30S ribosomal protein 3